MKKQKLKDILAKKSWYYVNSDITEENFPVPEKIETEGYKIIRMDKSFTSQEVLERIKKEGCRPANIYELAIFANEHPEEFAKEKYTWMIAFGSDYVDSDGCHRVPLVYARDDGDFGFRLGIFEFPWVGGDCFLCFCDPSSDTQALSTDTSSGSLTLEHAIQTVKSAGYKIIKEM